MMLIELIRNSVNIEQLFDLAESIIKEDTKKISSNIK